MTAPLDRLDPLEATARLAGCSGRILLHSGRDDDGLGRHSFVTAQPHATLIARGHSIVRIAHGTTTRFTADPLAAIEQFVTDHGCTLAASESPEPRVFGFLAYDLARSIERLPGGPPVGADTPDVWLAAYGAVAHWRAGDRGPTIVGADPSAREDLVARLGNPASPQLPPRFGALVADDDGAHHMARVDRIRDWIAAGDVYQVNLARRHVARVLAPGDPLAVYRALTAASPAPYGALIEADGVTVISGSPERFLGLVGDRIETRPIKGTRPRSPTGASELAASAKDAAEHLMIVDLERNDLGRVAEIGSVIVDELGYVIELPGLYHKVSRVSARLRGEVGHAALLRATFPGGSITGAPKVRAMEIIDELEPARRGPYCGAFGVFGRGLLELAIAIRIGVIKANELRIHVGGGIVADSNPMAELAETETKIAGWSAALASLARS